MDATTASSSLRVIDANIAVWAVLPSLPSRALDTTDWLDQWAAMGGRLAAPSLWIAECASALRRAAYGRQISPAAAHQAIEDLFALEVVLVPLTPELCHSTLDWATRLQQAKAYDSFYLAVAEQLGAEFWTADRRLANGARQAGAANVHWIGES